MGPTSSEIQKFTNITGLLAKEAEKWLKAYDCNTEKAINAYFEDDGVLKAQVSSTTDWDEDAFHSDRASGGSQHPPSFAVHAQDTLNPQVFKDDAPSRPPSRVSLKEPRPGMSLAEREDFEMQQAMSQSMTENQMAKQETGIITGTNPHFGPAAQEHYDTQKWTMTLPKTFAQEIIENPDPADRKRGPGEPAFFKPSLAVHRLPSLIKILHSISMGREALLNRARTLPDYGYDKEWWDGVPIDMERLNIVNALGQGHGTDSDDLIHETQRLMAFLDETNRAYGSVEALAQTPTLKNHPGELMTGKFLEAWTAAIVDSNADNPFPKVFETISITTDDEDKALDRHSHHFFDIPIPDTEAESGRNLYDIMDEQFWGDYLENNSGYNCLEEVGDILCIQLRRQSKSTSGTGVKIPAVLYLDRYLASAKPQVQNMLIAKLKMKQEIKILDDACDRIMKYTPPNGRETFDAPNLLAKAIQHFDDVSMSRDTSELKGNAQVTSQLKVLAQNVSNRITALQQSKSRAMNNAKAVAAWCTTAPEDDENPPHYKYMLRGVSASNETLYVLERQSPQIADSTEWCWWKLAYTKGDTKPVSRTIVREIEVLKAAKDHSELVLLVYASEKSLSVGHTPLPGQLMNFVRADNLCFSAEVDKFKSVGPATSASMGDMRDFEDETYHSSDDGLDAVDIALDDTSEQSPLIKKPGQSSPDSAEETTQFDSNPLKDYAASLKEMQEINEAATKRAYGSYGSDLDVGD